MQRQKVTRELLAYVSTTLSLDCSDLSELRSGAALVQLVHSLHPASFDLARATLRPTSAFQREKNFKLLQEALEKAGVDHEFSIRDVLDEKKPELYHLLVWACAHHRAAVAAAAAADDDGDEAAAYDAAAERQKVAALHSRRRAAAALRRSGVVGVGDDGGGSDLSGSIGSSCISGRSSSTNYLSSYNKSRAARFPVADRGRRPGAGVGGGSAGGGSGGGGGSGSHYHAHTKASASKAQFLRSNSADVRLPAAVAAACAAGGGASAPTATAAAAAATQQAARPPCPQQQAAAFPKTPPIPSVSTLTSSCGGLTESSTHTGAGTPSASAPVSPGCRAATEAQLPAAAAAEAASSAEAEAAAQGGVLLTLASQIAGVVAAAVTGADDDGAAAEPAEPAAKTPADVDAVSPSLPLPQQQQQHAPCEATTPVPACTPLTASNTTLCTISPMTTPEKRDCVGFNASGHDAAAVPAAAAAGRSPARTLHMDPTSGRLGHVVLVPGLAATAATPSATLAAAAAAAAAVAGSSASLTKGAAAQHRGVAGGVGRQSKAAAGGGGGATPSYRQRRKAPPSCALPRGSGHAGAVSQGGGGGGGGRASLRRSAQGGCDFMPGDFVPMKDKLPVGFNFIDPSTWSGETECPIAQVARWNEQQSLGECLDKLAGPARLSPSVYVHAQSNPHTPATSISHSIQSPAQSLFPTGLPLTNGEGGVSIVGGLGDDDDSLGDSLFPTEPIIG